MAGAVLQGVLVDQVIEVACEGAGHFGGASGAGAIDEALHPLVGKAMDPFPPSRIRKWSVSETVCRRWPLMTSRTACARRKTRASFVCLRKVSRVGRASSGKWSVRVRIGVASRKKYYKNSPDTWHLAPYHRNNTFSTQISLELL